MVKHYNSMSPLESKSSVHIVQPVMLHVKGISKINNFTELSR